MASTLAVGFGIATAAFLVSPISEIPTRTKLTVFSQGRAGLVAYRRSQGGVNAAGKAFFKGFV